MNSKSSIKAPEYTAVRVALWRALHGQIDAKPHIFTDDIGQKLVGEENWRSRKDMDPEFSKAMRASIVARARYVEDLLEEKVKQGVSQYVILGAGLDTFAQRRTEFAGRLTVFEIDQPGPQSWKQEQLSKLGFTPPPWLRFVPVDFERKESWWNRLIQSGFDANKPTFVASTGVSPYLSKETNFETLRQIAPLPPLSTIAMTFLLALDELEAKERSLMEFVMQKAKESGTPFLSLFSPTEILDLAKKAGFRNTKYVSAEDLYHKYFLNRSDGLRAGQAEAFLVAST